MPAPRDPDSEFGVPFPGRPLPRDRWTTTGLRDPGGAFDWGKTFGREARRVVDLGCGNGRYLIGSALARPDCDHVGVDLVQVAVDYAARRANRRGLTNVRFVVADAVEWMEERFTPSSLDEVHVYHPQPYYEADAASRRMLNPEFLERTWQVLRPGGLLVLQTDNKPYWTYLVAAAKKHFEPRFHPAPWEDAPRGRTRREIQARKQGLAVFRMEARRRDVPLDVEVPRPEFDADRPWHRKRRAGE